MKRPLLRLKGLNNERGAALIVVLMVFVVICILGAAITGLAANNMKMSSIERTSQASYYIAESGVTQRVNEIGPALKDVYGLAVNGTDFFNKVDNALELGIEKAYRNFESSLGQNPVAKVKIERVPSDTIISYSNDYKITSVGKIGNSSRKVTKIIHVAWKPKSSVTIPADAVLFSKDDFLVKNYKITGSVGSNGVITLQGGQASISGNVYNKVGTSLTMPDFPTFPIPATAVNFQETSLKMDHDKVFNTLTINSNSTLTIDVGKTNKNLVVNNLNLLSYGKIRIIGDGKLSIYAKNITLSGNNIINTDGNIEKLYIFLDGSGSTLNNGIIYGSMYANNTSLTVNNDSGIQGHLITNGTNIYINGAALTYSKMIYAPSATVSINASVTGAIICKTITSSGNDDNIKFQFVQINYDNSPLYVDNGKGLSPVKDMITQEPVRENN
uniref:Pilus assembly PilX N-terminal domain-containing protein n=1 Tax=Neobacillus citreus TaxID=2833578 RepID=A0A942T485_9BACI